MASKFFHVHHEFRAGKAQQWWETAQAAMAPGGGWDEAVAKNLEAGFYNHSFCPIGPEGPAFCIWEVREGITAEEFQEFIDGPNGVNFGLGAWMNICREINVEMAGTPPIFEEVLISNCRQPRGADVVAIHLPTKNHPVGRQGYSLPYQPLAGLVSL